MQREFQSADVARAAVRMALSETRADENELKDKLAAQGIRSVAVNFGGKFTDILPKIFESAIVAAQRQHVISDTHVGDGSVLGAMECYRTGEAHGYWHERRGQDRYCPLERTSLRRRFRRGRGASLQ